MENKFIKSLLSFILIFFSGLLIFLLFIFAPFFTVSVIVIFIFLEKNGYIWKLKKKYMRNKETLKCSSCGLPIKSSDKFCEHCGKPTNNNATGEFVQASDFNEVYNFNEDKVLENFINKELIKCGIDKKNKMLPSDLLKKKNVFNTIFNVLLFFYITIIFFHFPIQTYIIGFIILLIFYINTKRYNLIKYFIKEIKTRPSEKISNIIMNTKSTLVPDKTKIIFLLSTIIAIALPMLIFMKPKIIYEKLDDSYAVRFYIFGVTNFKSVTIPAEHNGKKVISLRGNTFSNMPFLTEVELPNTITSIRGQAFKNDFNLRKVNIPNNLEYLGGGSFYNCKSIENIELPDTLTYLGGESFYNASSLKRIKLSNNLSEIRGDSFSGCVSLMEITIPDKVTRIGGHAFYGNTNLARVNISRNSNLTEIGSSAFRLCDRLEQITLPNNTIVNYRAFKESPTQVLRFQTTNNNYGEDYTYSSNYYLKKDQTIILAPYYNYSSIHNNTLTLKEIVSGINGYQAVIDYNDGIASKEITVDMGYTINLNENLKLKVGSNYNLYDTAVGITAYYN